MIYVNGRFVPESRAVVPADDPALSWGIGLFEVTRIYGDRPFRLKDHVRRLRDSAKHFGFRSRLPGLRPIVRTLLRRNRLHDGCLRITLTRGGSVIVTVRRWTPPPERTYRRGATIFVAPWSRDPGSPLYGHKTLNYFENMCARWEARKRGAIDALFLGPKGEVLEGSASNIFHVRHGRLITPGLGSGVLPGVTRKVVLEAARLVGIRVSERKVRIAEFLRADEVFITNALLEVMPVAKIGRDRIGPPGPLTLDLAEAYREQVRKECGLAT